MGLIRFFKKKAVTDLHAIKALPKSLSEPSGRRRTRLPTTMPTKPLTRTSRKP